MTIRNLMLAAAFAGTAVLFWRVIDSTPKVDTQIRFAPEPEAFRHGMASCVEQLRLAGGVKGGWRDVVRVCEDLAGRAALRCIKNCPTAAVEARAPQMRHFPSPMHQPPRST